MKILSDLLSALPPCQVKNGALTCPIETIVYNSKSAAPHSLFVCLIGAQTDGHRYAKDAYQKGCRAFAVEYFLDLPSDACQIKVDDSRIALALLSAAFFDHPEKKLHIIGVTGTKGKSTVCEMIRHIFMQNGIQAGSIGTVGVKIGNTDTPTANTTPESYELFRIFRDMVDAGITHVCMEVSSQGIKMNRIYGIPFSLCVMTNLSEDHIGPTEHPTFEDYKNCKKSLFPTAPVAVLNADDPYFDEFFTSCSGDVRTYGIAKSADFTGSRIHYREIDGIYSTVFTANTPDTTEISVSLPFPGEFSVMNALAAIAVATYFGISADNSAKALATTHVSGRFETVETSLADVTFMIDYAHNGESLSSALQALRAYRPTRLICIVGSVGDRTEIRRKELGIAASSYADFTILTDDNPGKEDSLSIIHDIEQYMQYAPHAVIPDRKEAIEYAVSHAQSGDMILLAGKGHERYQLIGGKHIPFDERSCILNAVEKLTVLS